MKNFCLTLERLALLLILTAAGLSHSTRAGELQISGHWIVNYELSDDTDKQVEKAIKAAGGKIHDTGKKGRGRYKGGPPEQEIYDHLSYDETLFIQQQGQRFQFRYEDGFERVFYSDNRGRSVSASSLQSGKRQDFAFANWEGYKLLVEARPLDGGKTTETYRIDPVTGQLHVELKLNPLSFMYPVEIVRVYDRTEPTE